jgi:hypothetical protein
MSVVVAEEFRDGNVPAHQELLPITQRSLSAIFVAILPATNTA